MAMQATGIANKSEVCCHDRTSIISPAIGGAIPSPRLAPTVCSDRAKPLFLLYKRDKYGIEGVCHPLTQIPMKTAAVARIKVLVAPLINKSANAPDIKHKNCASIYFFEISITGPLMIVTATAAIKKMVTMLPVVVYESDRSCAINGSKTMNIPFTQCVTPCPALTMDKGLTFSIPRKSFSIEYIHLNN